MRPGGWHSAQPRWRRTTRTSWAGWRCCERTPATSTPLRELIERRPGTRQLLDWLRAHDEVQLSDEVMEQL